MKKTVLVIVMSLVVGSVANAQSANGYGTIGAVPIYEQGDSNPSGVTKRQKTDSTSGKQQDCYESRQCDVFNNCANILVCR